MKLELDFTTKTITIVGECSCSEFKSKVEELKLEDWKIVTKDMQYIPYYPTLSTYPTYEVTCASTTTDCGCNDKCKGE